MALDIRDYRVDDEDELLSAFATVVKEGGAFPRRPPADTTMLHSAWLDNATTVQIGRLDGQFAGAYYLRPALPGLAAHIANAGYQVVPELRRRGVGTELAEHSFLKARRCGFDAMLFTLVLGETRAAISGAGLGFWR
jgi:GNAT superfamily N-acetyltransferase